MKLTFQQPYLSIKEFPTADLPPFTLITGLNGSGKTHLLKAIKAGGISIDSAPDRDADIRFFDWNSMVPQDSGLFDGRALHDQRTNLVQQFEYAHRQHIDRVFSVARTLGLSGTYVSDVAALARLTIDDFTQILADPEKAKAAKEAIAEAIRTVSIQVRGALQSDYQRFQLDALARDEERPIAVLNRDDFSAASMPLWGRADVFQQSFAQLFVAYRDLRLNNLLKRTAKVTDHTILSDEAFVERYGISPWSFVNDTFDAAGLDFEIDQPDPYSYTQYEPILKKRSSNAHVRFTDLSSGEKIIMSFALCVYYAEDKRQVETYPKLLLLDEIDAPLHPSLSRSLIQTVIQTLVAKHKICVIATTHSPSTVAVAPEDSLYAMYSSRPGLHKTGKAQSLNVLTDGVPTLAISYEGRRQVFVESPSDARLYGAIHEILKPRLASERSLEFIATGGRSPNDASHTNTGCDNVVRIVGDLVDAGNSSVFGLIDWDGVRESSERITVLAQGRRNGLENAIFDPLLVTALIVREARAHTEEIGLPKGYGYPDFLSLTPGELQPIVDRLQTAVLGASAPMYTDTLYLGNFSLRLDRAYLEVDDHKLEDLILKGFPALNAIAKKRTGALMQHIVDAVMRDKPDFVPMDIFQTFSTLLDRPSHSLARNT